MISSIQDKNREWKYFIILAVLLAFIMAFTDEQFATNKFIMFVWLDVLLLQRSIKLDIGDALIVLATFAYRIISNPDPGSVMWGMIRVFALYQIAKYFADPCGDGKRDKEALCEGVAFVILAMSVALFLKGILNHSYFLTDSAFLSKEEWPLWNPKWTSLDFTREDVMMRSPEEQQFFMILMGSILPYFILKVKKEKILGIAGILMSAAAMWMGTLSTGALGFVCALTATIVTFIVYGADKGMFSNIRALTVIGAVIDIITAFIVLTELNVWGLGTVMRHVWSNADRRFYSERFYLMGQGLSFMPEYPFGDYENRLVIPNVRTAYYAYNSWIDTAVHAGFIPFVLYVAYLVFNIICLICVCRKVRGIAKYMLVSAFTGMTAYHMLQPAFLQDRRYWYLEVFLGALACGLYYAVSGKKRPVLSIDGISKRFIYDGNENKA